jgi:hypothetical protein
MCRTTSLSFAQASKFQCKEVLLVPRKSESSSNLLFTGKV